MAKLTLNLTMSKPYKCIFFDLDHTLWDYETNSCDTLGEIYTTYRLLDRGVDNVHRFQEQFRVVNTSLWDLYDRGVIDSEVIRKERFKQILEQFGIADQKLIEDISVDYLYSCPKKANLVPRALETLEYLSGFYAMTVVTNGFEEIQNVKLSAGNIHRFFSHVVTSQKAGHKKPSAGIFEYAMQANGVKPEEVVMIGDNLLTDIAGALNASIDAVFFNPARISHAVAVKHEINCLSELQKIL